MENKPEDKEMEEKKPIDSEIVDEEEKIIDNVDPKEVEVVEAAVEPGETVEKKAVDHSSWMPKTDLGRKVKQGAISNIDEILDSGKTILEPHIVDVLVPDMESDLLLIGQSKGKFGGGQKRVFRQTQKKTREGNKPKFAAFAIVGNNNGLVGLGYGKAKETVPAREKSFRMAKLNLMKIRRGCGSWQCSCGTPHTIPFKVTGKCGAVEITFMPAPKGTGLCADSEIAKILKIAGIKDVWSKTRGKSRTKMNHVLATIEALKMLQKTKIQSVHEEALSIADGIIREDKNE